jgi:hypothetical protein
LAVPRALLRIEGNTLEIDVPEAHIGPAGNKRITLKASRIVVPALGDPAPRAEIEARAQGPLAVLLDLASREQVGLLKSGAIPPGADGKVEAHWRLVVPLAERLKPADLRVEGKVRITEGRFPDAVGPHDVTGGNFTIALTEKAIDLKGEMLLAGILAKASGQWLMGEPRDRQSPLTITARLDTADRRQLGLDIDEFVQGEVPVEVQLAAGEQSRRTVQVAADLTGAELMLDGLAWRKPAGRAARLAFDVVRPAAGKGLELDNFKLAGDNITIDGHVQIGPDNKPLSYRFPGFSLNVVSNLEVEGQRRKDGIWEVKARGKTFDATELIRTHYALDQAARPGAVKAGAAVSKGFDLEATVDTVLGLSDTSLRQVRIRMSERGGIMTALDFAAGLEGGGTLSARLVPAPGQPRIINAQTDNAGQALKLVGLYTSMLGGQGEVKLNLDARGGADRSGAITIRKFRVLGDPVVYEVLQSAEDGRPETAAAAVGGRRPGQRIVREEIAFDELRGTIAGGNGQLALESLGAHGPLVGFSLRGKVDLRSRRVALGGTYVPLSGINRALSGIPVVREFFTGPRGEGVFGFTYAVQGSMSEPQVLVNPFSIVAPGVLREIFQMAPENPRVPPAPEPGRTSPTPPGRGPRIRASPPSAPARPQAAPGDARVLDGWSSESTRSKP